MSSSKTMPIYKKFVQEGVVKYKLHEFMEKLSDKAGFHGVEISSTPIRDIITVYVESPGVIIGRGGRTSRRIGDILKEELGIQNPYIQTKKVEEPFLSARIVASYIARRIAKGERYRKVAYSALRRVMAAGAKGVEIRLSGKFGSQRAREERFRDGVIYRCGQDYMENVEYAVKHVLMPQGMIGVRVRIVKPGVKGPDTVEIKEDAIEEITEKLRSEIESVSGSEIVEIPEELEEEFEVAGEVEGDASEQTG